MPEALGSWQAPVASWALTYLLHSTVIIALAWALTRTAWLRGPRSQEVIWTVALLGGLVTSLAAGREGRVPWAPPMEIDVTVVREARRGPPQGGSPGAAPGGPLHRLDQRGGGAAPARLVWHGGEAGPERLVWHRGEAGPERLVWHRGEAGPLQAGRGLSEACRRALAGEGRGSPEWVRSVAAACESGGGVGWPAALLALWLAGAVALVGKEARRHRALERVRRGLAPASPRARSALDRVVAGTPEGRRARVTVSREVEAPCVVDSRTVVLPPRCQDELADEELLAVLAHEVAHIRRRDVCRQGLVRLAAAALWLQPLNRLVAGRLNDVAELICDDWAVDRIGAPLDLARSISRVAAWSSPARRREPVLAGSQGGRLSERVGRILGARGGGGSGGRLRGALVAAALVLALAQLPSVSVPGRVRSVYVLQDRVQVDSVVQEVRVLLRRGNS